MNEVHEVVRTLSRVNSLNRRVRDYQNDHIGMYRHDVTAKGGASVGRLAVSGLSAREPTNKRYQGRVRREESKRIQWRHYSMHIAGIISLLSPSSEDEGRKRVASRRPPSGVVSSSRRFFSTGNLHPRRDPGAAVRFQDGPIRRQTHADVNLTPIGEKRAALFSGQDGRRCFSAVYKPRK